MPYPSAAGATLLDTLTTRADSRAVRQAERIAAVSFVTVLTAIAAQVSVPLPFTPVPFTFQPMIVLLGGAALGARLGLKIGRASCRGRVEISVVGGSLKKKK